MQLLAKTSLNRYLAVPFLALSACAVEPGGPSDEGPFVGPNEGLLNPEGETPPAPPSFFIPPRQGMEVQCPWLLGEELDTLPGTTAYHLSVLAAGTSLTGAPLTA